MADDEYTPEQLSKIARHFVYVMPHGEAHEVIKDLKKIVKPSSIIDDKWVENALGEYHKKRFDIISGDTSKVICCPQGEVNTAPPQFLNPDKKVVCYIDTTNSKILEEKDASDLGFLATGKVEEYRSAISAALQKYLSDFYEDGSSPNSVARGMGSVYAAPNGMIAVVISYKNLNQNNYWTGGWQSEWTTNIDKNGKVSLEGRIRLNVHYYEDGNVQLNSNFSEKAELNVTSAEETAEAMLKTIMELENDFQNGLDQFYQKMHDSTFKNMRRFLPKTQKKMDWRARTHNLVSEAAAQ